MTNKVYVLKAGEYYKIGITSREVSKRIRDMQTGNPYTIECIAEYNIDSAITVERVLHNKYTCKRLSGEWFNLDTDDLSDIAKICNEHTSYSIPEVKESDIQDVIYKAVPAVKEYADVLDGKITNGDYVYVVDPYAVSISTMFVSYVTEPTYNMNTLEHIATCTLDTNGPCLTDTYWTNPRVVCKYKESAEKYVGLLKDIDKLQAWFRELGR